MSFWPEEIDSRLRSLKDFSGDELTVGDMWEALMSMKAKDFFEALIEGS